MKISLEWIRYLMGHEALSFTELRKVKDQLAFRGLEVDGEESLIQNIQDVIVGKVVKKRKHPDADKLNICTVTTGQDAHTLQIVCGAPNVDENMFVALAPVNAVLPGDFKIKKSKIRGIESLGMLCSEKELGLSSESEGIMNLGQKAQDFLGKPLCQFLDNEDYVWDVELTPDRGDCLSHRGVLRELSSLVGKPLKYVSKKSKSNDMPLFQVEVIESKSCPFYTAQLFENVKMQDSPKWMVKRLQSMGIAPKGLLVDVTNYVLFEIGQPLHAFDADCIEGSKLIVRFAKDGESLLALDDNTYELSSKDLVIADTEKVLALAGVIGGKESAVSSSTKRIVLEAAYFNPDCVRDTVQRHNVSTDSSYRFERGVDLDSVTEAVEEVSVVLSNELNARRRGGITLVKDDEFLKNQKEKRQFNFDLRTFSEVVGYSPEFIEVIEALKSVGIEAQEKSSNVISLNIPGWRNDLQREIDVVEEVARLLGYERIPEIFPVYTGHVDSQIDAKKKAYDILKFPKKIMLEAGLGEVMPFNFVSEKELEYTFIKEDKKVELEKPISDQWKFMRPNLSFGLFESLRCSTKRSQLNNAIFDSGRVFEKVAAAGKEDWPIKEHWHLSWLKAGHHQENAWYHDKSSQDRKLHVDYFDAKGIFEKVSPLLSTLEGRWQSVQYKRLMDIENLEEIITEQAPWIPLKLLDSGRSALLVWPGKGLGKIMGYIGELHPMLKNSFLGISAKLSLGVAIGEIRLFEDLLEEPVYGTHFRLMNSHGKIKPSSLQPFVERDFSFVINPKISHQMIQKSIQKSAPKYCKQIQCLDRYELEDKTTSVCYRVTLRDSEKALAEKEIEVISEHILQNLKKECSIESR